MKSIKENYMSVLAVFAFSVYATLQGMLLYGLYHVLEGRV